MIELKDGPCKGTYLVKRAPLFLRAVKDKNGQTDVLDQLDDTPRESEVVYIYQLDGEAGWIHLYARGKGGKAATGFYMTGAYHHLPEVDGQILRETSRWQQWVTEQPAKGGEA